MTLLEPESLTRDFSFRPLVAFLSCSKLAQLFVLALLERKVVLNSQKLSPVLLVVIMEALRALLFPFDWEHTYLPMLPNSFRWALESPAPFLMGVCGKLAPSELPAEAVGLGRFGLLAFFGAAGLGSGKWGGVGWGLVRFFLVGVGALGWSRRAPFLKGTEEDGVCVCVLGVFGLWTGLPPSFGRFGGGSRVLPGDLRLAGSVAWVFLGVKVRQYKMQK
ncbi:unnamed protein product [Effrenium voratum]|nr:unnamed protein product [Effrenium voratum]